MYTHVPLLFSTGFLHLFYTYFFSIFQLRIWNIYLRMYHTLAKSFVSNSLKGIIRMLPEVIPLHLKYVAIKNKIKTISNLLCFNWNWTSFSNYSVHIVLGFYAYFLLLGKIRIYTHTHISMSSHTHSKTLTKNRTPLTSCQASATHVSASRFQSQLNDLNRY